MRYPPANTAGHATLQLGREEFIWAGSCGCIACGCHDFRPQLPCLPAREGLETMGAQPHRDGSGCWKATSRFASAPNDAAHRRQEPIIRPVQLHPSGCLLFLHTIHCFGCLAFAVHAMQAKAYVSLSMMKLIWLLPLEVAREIQRAVLACTPHKRSGLFTRAEASPVRLDTHDTTASTATAIARLRYGRGHRVQSRVATR